MGSKNFVISSCVFFSNRGETDRLNLVSNELFSQAISSIFCKKWERVNMGREISSLKVGFFFRIEQFRDD